MKTMLLLVPVAVGAALLMQTQIRGIDPDELEHLHAACAISWGDVPYRDFFEHHPPALYYLLQPILRVTGAELPALAWSRLLMWLFGMAALAATAGVAYRTSGKTAAMAAPALLCCTTVFFSKTIEVRPDVPAMLLLSLAAFGIVASEKQRGLAALFVGFSLGLTILLTQKSLVPAAAMLFAQAIVFRHGRKTALILVGITAVWVIAFGLFSTAGAAGAFFHAAVVQLVRWPVRQNPITALRPTLSADLPLWFGAAAAIVTTIRRNRATPASTNDAPAAALLRLQCREFLSTVVALSFVGGLLIHAAYTQYYLLWFPLAAVLAADSFVRWGSGIFERRSRQAVLLIAIALLAIEMELTLHAIQRGNNGALPHFIEQFSLRGFGVFAIVVLAILPAIVGICCVRGRRGVAVFCLAAMGFGYAGLRNFDAVCWSNLDQMAYIELVDQKVAPDETVFDGYTGLGVFRRHAYYYWWLNPYSLALMSPDQRGRELLAALKKSPPKIVCFDENIKRLPQSVQAWIAENYRPLQPPLYVRNK
jgi:hypothetical protein